MFKLGGGGGGILGLFRFEVLTTFHWRGELFCASQKTPKFLVCMCDGGGGGGMLSIPVIQGSLWNGSFQRWHSAAFHRDVLFACAVYFSLQLVMASVPSYRGVMQFLITECHNLRPPSINNSFISWQSCTCIHQSGHYLCPSQWKPFCTLK